MLKKRGVTLIEIVVASGIIMIAVVSIFSTFAMLVKFSLGNTEYIQAALLAEEGVEAVKSLRDVSYSSEILSLLPDTLYYLQWNGSGWVLSTTPSMIDGVFERVVTVDYVYRDNITKNIDIDRGLGSAIDQYTRNVIVSVSWREGTSTSTKEVNTYIHDIFNN